MYPSEIDSENDIAVLTLDSCHYNDEYKACLKQMFTEMKEQEIHNVAVDLRANGGGDSRVADEFIRYLDVDTWKDTKYNRRYNHMGIIIGEACGNTPNGYGDIAMFALPNSQLFMQISTKQFFRIDQDNPSDLVEPDIPCESDDAMEMLYGAITD